MVRHDKRRANQLRPLKITYNIFEYAAGSVLFEQGKTKVLCAVSLQPSVPPFLRNKGLSWLTAEYALLPASTVVRTPREISVMRRSGRSIEISRLISRSLRAVFDNTVLGEQTLMVDCDVLQADGCTRTVSISAAYAALSMAQERWLAEGTITRPFLKEGIAAVAVGMMLDKTLVLDPDYHEDSTGIADLNVIMTYSGKLIEMQGGAEQEPIDVACISEIVLLARKGIATIASFIEKHTPPIILKHDEKIPLFSLHNRQNHSSE